MGEEQGVGEEQRQRFFASVDLNQNRTKRNTEKSAGAGPTI